MAEVHLPPSDVARPAGVTLAERWADFTKAFAIYPESNHRVRVALDALVEALARTGQDATGKPVQIVFHRDAIEVDGTETALGEGTNLRWLSERIHKAALAGVVFAADLGEEALLAFTRQLLEHFTRPLVDAAFVELWPEPYPGLELLERRFEGEFGHDGVVGGGQTRSWGGSGSRQVDLSQEEVLVQTLAENPGIRARLERLRGRLQAAADVDEPSVKVDILGRIVKLLPTDAIQELPALVDLAGEVLDRLADTIGRGGEADETELNQLLFAASRGLLARQSRAPVALVGHGDDGDDGDTATPSPSDTAGPRGHAGDEAITDDARALMAEIAELPAAFEEELGAENAFGRAEAIGVYLHNLVRTENRDVARRITAGLGRLLEAPGEDEVAVLREYIVSYWYRADERATELAFERILDFLLEARQAPLLRREGFLGVEVVVGTFPRYFGLYLDSIDTHDPDQRAELAHVVQAIGRDRLQNASDRLVKEEKLLVEERTTRLLESPSPVLLPLARLVLEHGDEGQRGKAVAYLRRLNLSAKETAPLYMLDDPSELPRSYLTALADPDPDGTYPRSLAGEIASIICRFLRKTAGRSDLTPRRVYAVTRLAAFPSREGRDLLRHLLRRRFLLFPAEPGAIRQAARAALQRIGEL